MICLHDTGHKAPARRQDESLLTTSARAGGRRSDARDGVGGLSGPFSDRQLQFHFHPPGTADSFCRVVHRFGRMTGRKTTIDLSDDSDRWQWVCPVGHRTWEPTNFHYWCRQCARSWSHNEDVEPEFHYLRNSKTDKLVAREDVLLVYGDDAYEHTEGSA